MSGIADTLGGMRTRRSPLLVVLIPLGLLLVACGDDGGGEAAAEDASVTSAVVSDEGFARLGVDEFAAELDDPRWTVINVHIPYEGEIEGTDLFLPFDTILDEAELPADPSAPLLLYCRSGRMSEEAAAALVDAGYTEVAHLEGGMVAWEAAGNELVDDPAR